MTRPHFTPLVFVGLAGTLTVFALLLHYMFAGLLRWVIER